MPSLAKFHRPRPTPAVQAPPGRLRTFDLALKNLPTGPGVYRFLNIEGEVLYIGKARNLRKRVQSYYGRHGLSARAQSLIHHTVDVAVTVTHTENEALLLENNLIKSLRPRYNVVLRDDKSYPYIFVSETQNFPRLAFHRGAKHEKGRYFGPYPSAGAVRESLNLLQKVFTVRQCEDSFFRNRSRPCLQYQIKRCSAPCVNLVDPARYADDVRHAVMFLEGKSRVVIEEMVKRMEQASLREDYEAAGLYRDRIAALKRIQERQYISGKSGDADVFAVAVSNEGTCIEAVFIRGGLNLGSKSFFPKVETRARPNEVLAAFLPQYYLNGAGGTQRLIPARIYLSHAIPDRALVARVFSDKTARQVAINTPATTRGAPRRWVRMAELNAAQVLHRHDLGQLNLRQRFEALREALGLDELLERIECFDISHTQGEATQAACVVFDVNGPVKSDYRRFNIEGVPPGDDYAALTQALERRYRRMKSEPEISRTSGGRAPAQEGRLPDILLIDGGKGQVAAARAVLDEFQIERVLLVGVAKGRERRPGREQLFLSGTGAPTILPPDSPALHLIQQIRDEAHRFAITGHRLRRGRARTRSSLEEVAGIGAKRRQALLKNLGGLREVARAGVEDLARIPGISPSLARRIYDAFHESEH